MLRACLVAALLGGCWKGASPPPPTPAPRIAAAPRDSCTEERLRAFAASIDASVEALIVAPGARPSDARPVKCAPGSSDDACLAHARANAVLLEGWEIVDIAIDNSGPLQGYEVELDVDGTREIRMYPDVAASVVRAVELQAQGKHVTMLRGEAKRGGGDRVARVELQGPPGPSRRTAKLHTVHAADLPAKYDAIQDGAEAHGLEVLKVAAREQTVEVTVGCAPE